ncbi:ArsR family transcriptional regulator [Halobellus rarus]|uniref:ArsR family transcriptional regulator n=1 Tax=Halobellus rarus TaxID=1126237 RepID=A0ABD6CHB2_9EURY|nr:ArsR family transcriptional regulator [Halobellus rarus]
MHPHLAETNTADTGGEPDGFEAWTALQKATDQTRANLIADIVGHPQEAPSVQELDYMNPALGEDAIRRHLRVLQDIGVVAELVVEPGNRVRGYPYKFYQITPEARELFDRNDLFPEDAWQRQYARVEKTGEIAEIEEMPRPE